MVLVDLGDVPEEENEENEEKDILVSNLVNTVKNLIGILILVLI